MSNHQETDSRVEIDPETGFVTEAAPSPGSQEPESASLSQVRDILIGPVSQDLRRGLTHLEQRVEQTFRELAESTNGRLDDLERRLVAMIDDLRESQGKQDTTHSEQLEQARKERESILADLRNQAENFSERISGTQGKMRDEVMREVRTVRGEIEQLGVRLEEDLSDRICGLRDEMVDRTSLASSLSEVVMRISGPSAIMDADPSEAEIDGLLDGPPED